MRLRGGAEDLLLSDARSMCRAARMRKQEIQKEHLGQELAILHASGQGGIELRKHVLGELLESWVDGQCRIAWPCARGSCVEPRFGKHRTHVVAVHHCSLDGGVAHAVARRQQTCRVGHTNVELAGNGKVMISTFWRGSPRRPRLYGKTLSYDMTVAYDPLHPWAAL